eukprot:4055097-Amphidinium_carterae.1
MKEIPALKKLVEEAIRKLEQVAVSDSQLQLAVQGGKPPAEVAVAVDDKASEKKANGIEDDASEKKADGIDDKASEQKADGIDDKASEQKVDDKASEQKADGIDEDAVDGGSKLANASPNAKKEGWGCNDNDV